MRSTHDRLWVVLLLVSSIASGEYLLAQTQSYRLSEAFTESEVHSFKEKARAGDADAALSLYRHYALGIGDAKLALPYTCRAAELGSCDGAEIAADLFLLRRYRNLKRAVVYRGLYDRNCRGRIRKGDSARWAVEALARLKEEGLSPSQLEPLRRFARKVQ
jgi:hypothetical protein